LSITERSLIAQFHEGAAHDQHHDLLHVRRAAEAWSHRQSGALVIGLCRPITVVFDLNAGQCHLQRRLQRHHDLLAGDR
jgi:hypothetical protein